MGINLSNLNYVLIQNNNITTSLSGVTYGIHFGDCKNTTIIGNSISSSLGQIIDDNIGINAQDSTANINFNRIYGFTYFGLTNQNSMVNYANNWWGTNNPLYTTDGNSHGDVCDPSAISNPCQYLKLKISSTKKDIGPSNTCKITTDLTHDNDGNSTPTSGNLPDGIPINFTSTFGTITNIGYTKSGKAVTTFTAGSIYGNAITATLDNQTVSLPVSIVGVYNNRTLVSYTSLQSAINDSSTSPGDTIIIVNGTYTENIVINKRVNISGDNNSVIIGSITINSGGNGTKILDF